MAVHLNVKKEESDRKLQYIMIGIGFIFFTYLCARTAYYMDATGQTSMFLAMVYVIPTLSENPFALAFNKTFFSVFGLGLIVIVILAQVARDHKVLNAHYKDGEQCGTAKWQNPRSIKMFNRKFNAPYGKPIADGDENTIYSKNCFVTMNTRQTGLNNNSMIIGGPGSGKSLNIVRPNLMQMYGSYVITDPSGELMATTGRMFEDAGYEIKVFNLCDMPHSNCYNPFEYLRGEEDVLTLISCLIKNTEGKGKSGDPFWEKAETALLQAIIFYLIRYQKKDKQNFAMVSKLLRQAKTDPQATSSQLDKIFDEVRAYNKNDICLKQYDIFKQASEKTAQSILITAAVRLAPFNVSAVEDLTCKDEMDLSDLGDKKTITYIIVPQGNNPYAFLVNMMYSQMFDSLYSHAAADCEGLRLKYDVRFILDEFANIGVIPDFQVKLTTMRKYGLSVMIFIQAVGQIKNLYEDDWETLMGACDTLVYLGGNELSSMEDLSKKLGQQTIRVRDSSHTKSGKGGSDSHSIKYTKRELLTVDEIRRLEKGCCIVVIKGEDPFYDEKYFTFEHPKAKLLGDLGSGVGLYQFDQCNTRPENVADKERKLKAKQEAAVKKAEQEKRPGAKPIVGRETRPETKPPTPEEQAEKAKQIAAQTASMAYDKESTLAKGATITTVKNGIASVAKRNSSSSRKSTVVGHTATKPAAPPQSGMEGARSAIDRFSHVEF